MVCRYVINDFKYKFMGGHCSKKQWALHTCDKLERWWAKELRQGGLCNHGLWICINFMAFKWANICWLKKSSECSNMCIRIIRCKPDLQNSSRSPSQNWLCPWLSLPALLLLFPQLREASQAFLLRSERRESYEAHKLRPPRSERGGGLDSGATSRRRMEVGTRGDESCTVFLGW